jgi:hypothetical protein
MASMAREIRFDPAKLVDEKGRVKRLDELDKDTRTAVRVETTPMARSRCARPTRRPRVSER